MDVRKLDDDLQASGSVVCLQIDISVALFVSSDSFLDSSFWSNEAPRIGEGDIFLEDIQRRLIPVIIFVVTIQLFSMAVVVLFERDIVNLCIFNATGEVRVAQRGQSRIPQRDNLLDDLLNYII